jgi:outer membrane protein
MSSPRAPRILPDLALNYTYGIDSPQFALNAYDGSRNLGYSASATLNIPVWDWFTTHDKVRQSEINRTSRTVTLTNTQRKLIADAGGGLRRGGGRARPARQPEPERNHGGREPSPDDGMSYSAGESTILEVVDAENSLTSSELAREDGMVRYQTALANLQLLTGTL